ncbi:hypothetical protein [Amycolatopsis sp. NPDC050768]|uniref:hypothetical protein n=1 Tax=Amycolatopsis sp. NPDC050768 TaxID=3154839 RepID=UPI0033CE99E6
MPTPHPQKHQPVRAPGLRPRGREGNGMTACRHTAFIAKLKGGWVYKTCRNCPHSWSESMPRRESRTPQTATKR